MYCNRLIASLTRLRSCILVEEMRREKGIHILLDMEGVDPAILDDSLYLNNLIDKVVKESGLKSFGTLYHKFIPQGFTSVTLLSASHISIHTWPEYGYIAADIFACEEPEKAIKAADILIRELKPKKVTKTVRRRGYVFTGYITADRDGGSYREG